MNRSAPEAQRYAWLAFAAAILALMGAGLAHAEQAADHYRNPVIEPVAADPHVIRDDDGTWYLYATQDRHDDGVERYLPIFASEDLVEWRDLGDAFLRPPAWKREGFLWAPDVSRDGNGWRMYYALSTWGDPNPCIGTAFAPHPAGPWSDLGRPLFCSDEIGVRNSIDPFHLQSDDGARLLFWGSFYGIYVAPLTEDGTAVAGEPVRVADGRFEAAFVHRREGAYYLFLSSGSCCEGSMSSYATWVGRADDPRGPFVDALGRDLRTGGGEMVLYRNDAWVGPGHVAIVSDDAGTDWIVYHAIDPERPWLRSGATRRPTLIDAIDWIDGWPQVEDGKGPSDGPRPAPQVDRR